MCVTHERIVWATHNIYTQQHINNNMSFSFWQVGDRLTYSRDIDQVLNAGVSVAQATAGWFVALAGGAVVWKAVGSLYEHLNQRDLVSRNKQADLDYDKIEKTGNLFATYGTAGTAISLSIAYYIAQSKK
ncbi:hypothetical protein PROFUN_07964 [Planoprotostelium fungivorum]|uniref:Uncharacterized protein n=1 Tax=Planoprotostelium fungivorum TaxID=1890364 RepID=A0A2P6NL81_9EUKA|nr:hypothetical protein PROFUN_07964 [Planoprotostelium fungivorum]